MVTQHRRVVTARRYGWGAFSYPNGIALALTLPIPSEKSGCLDGPSVVEIVDDVMLSPQSRDGIIRYDLPP